MKKIRGLTDFFKALADDNRLQIMEMLLERELCVCEIMTRLPLSQAAVSHHLKILKQAGLLRDRREGKWIFYNIDEEGFMTYLQAFEQRLAGPVQELTRHDRRLPADTRICIELEK